MYDQIIQRRIQSTYNVGSVVHGSGQKSKKEREKEEGKLPLKVGKYSRASLTDPLV